MSLNLLTKSDIVKLRFGYDYGFARQTLSVALCIEAGPRKAKYSWYLAFSFVDLKLGGC